MKDMQVECFSRNVRIPAVHFSLQEPLQCLVLPPPRMCFPPVGGTADLETLQCPAPSL